MKTAGESHIFPNLTLATSCEHWCGRFACDGGVKADWESGGLYSERRGGEGKKEGVQRAERAIWCKRTS